LYPCFDRRIARAKVPEITVHGARKTCGSLLATLDVLLAERLAADYADDPFVVGRREELGL
jgi:hypothetical protein